MKLRAAILAISVASSASAQDDAAAIARDARTYLEQAALSLTEAESANDRIAALTNTIRAYEAGLSAMREGLRQAAVQEAQMRTRLQGEQQELDSFLTLLTRVSRSAEQDALLHPGGAVDTIRAGTLVASFVPALKQEAAEVEADLADLAGLITLQEAGVETLSQAVSQVQDARAQLAAAMSARTDLPSPLATDDAAIAALINSTETLSAFADGLASVGGEGFAQQEWQIPAIGEIRSGFNETDASGIRRPGWILATAAQALVTAPVTATVRFSGDIPGQGLVSVLEHKPGLLVILTGFGQLYTDRGQIVFQGEPIGLMGGQFTPAQENLNKSVLIAGQSQAETLYIEIRQAEAARDPAEFFPAAEE